LLIPVNKGVGDGLVFEAITNHAEALRYGIELDRRGAIKPLLGLGCSPVQVSGTKKLFLKWIRSALRQKRIEVPDRNGPVRWNLAHSFFRVNRNNLEEESRQEKSDKASVIRAVEALLRESSERSQAARDVTVLSGYKDVGKMNVQLIANEENQDRA
jgi:hypothetical protein